MPFTDPTLIRLGKILLDRATAIDAEVARIGQHIGPDRVAALQEIAGQFRDLAKELRA